VIDSLADSLLWTAFLTAAVRMTIPILIAAVGEGMTERSGILNIAVEGMMLVGAFFAVLGSYLTGSPSLGLASGIIAAAVVAAVHAYFSITVLADQVVCGAALNFVCFGLTGFLNRVIFAGSSGPSGLAHFSPIDIPVLSSLPIVGASLFHQTAPCYVALAVVAGLWVFLWKTTAGLNLRAVGEHPLAAETVGLDVVRYRYAATIAGGALAGFGGGFLSLAIVNFFVEDMTNGRGFIALAAVIFGRWNPLGILAASFLFGAADALQLTIKSTGIDLPYQFLLMLPYILTIIALAIFAGHPAAPRALYQPYNRSRQ
jgi:ABC-type uncharacterized transport system permease subunit